MSDEVKQTPAAELTEQELQEIQKRTLYSVEQIREWYASFLDECPSGRLQQDEFIRLYKQFYPHISREDKFSKLAFESFDTNRDGYIDFTEFVLMITAAAKVEASMWIPNMQATVAAINQAWLNVTPCKGMLTSGLSSWPGVLPPQNSSMTTTILSSSLLPVHYLILATPIDADPPIVMLSNAPRELHVTFGHDTSFLINDIRDVDDREGKLVFKLILLTRVSTDNNIVTARGKTLTTISNDHVQLIRELINKRNMDS